MEVFCRVGIPVELTNESLFRDSGGILEEFDTLSMGRPAGNMPANRVRGEPPGDADALQHLTCFVRKGSDRLRRDVFVENRTFQVFIGRRIAFPHERQQLVDVAFRNVVAFVLPPYPATAFRSVSVRLSGPQRLTQRLLNLGSLA
jgi:hypothetical protein